MVKSIFAGVVLALTTAAPLTAHPLHTSFTELVKDEKTGQVAISIRLFADDFGTALDSLSRAPAARGVDRNAVARAYFERAVALSGKDGAVPLEWCGMRTVENLTWLCARTAAPVPKGALRIRNALMFDRFADQISIVRWTSRAGDRTRVLSGRAPEAILD